jgi:hypothetical protein
MRNLQSILIYLLVAIFTYSCSQKPLSNNPSGKKDSLLNSFFKMVDTLPYYDTNNIDYRLLKAYKENDTLSLSIIINYLGNKNVKPWMNSYLKPCAKNQEFDTLKADEAYRFFYESSFCPYFTVATIIQSNNIVKANVVVYKNAEAMDSIPCTIAQHNEITVDSISWSKFKDVMFNTDFWGSKEDNGIHGVDGSTLEVMGYKNSVREMKGVILRGPKRSYISRWSRSMDRYLDPFMLLLKFCKINTGCIKPI